MLPIIRREKLNLWCFQQVSGKDLTLPADPLITATEIVQRFCATQCVNCTSGQTPCFCVCAAFECLADVKVRTRYLRINLNRLNF
jgi:hypothetical protein